MILAAGFLSLILLIWSTHRVTTYFEPDHILDYLLVSAIVFPAYIVVVAESLSLIRQLNNPYAWLLAQALLTGSILTLTPKSHLRKYRINLRDIFQEWSISQKVMLLALSAATFYNIVIILVVPQNNPDSLSTHLARIGHWLLSGTLTPWPIQPVRIWQVIYPVNAQILIFWTVLFSGSDIFAGFIQLFAVIVAVFAVYKISLLLGFSKSASRWSSMLFYGFPLLQLQASTTQTDMVIMSFLVLAVYAILKAFQTEKIRYWTLVGSAIGLGIGTKQTFFFLLPILLLLVLIIAWPRRRQYLNIKTLSKITGITVLTIMLLGSGSYIRNQVAFGNPLGPSYVVEKATGTQQPQALLKKIPVNTVRFIYQMIDPAGLPRPYLGYAHKMRLHVFRAILGGTPIESAQYTFQNHIFSYDLNPTEEESSAWYGPISIIFLYPAMLWALFYRKKRYYLSLRVFPISFGLFLIIDIIARPGWDPFQGRYFAGVIAFNALLMGLWFEKRRRSLEILATILNLVVVFVTLAYNPAKPSLGKWADDIGIWEKDRIFLQTVQYKADRKLYYQVAENVPSGSKIGLFAPTYMLTYPLYGESFERQIIEIWPSQQVTANTIQKLALDYLLIYYPSLDEIPDLPCRKTVFSSQNWLLTQCP